MSKKPTHLRPHNNDEPHELEAPRASIDGKEPVHVRDMDQEALIRAIHEGQVDLIPKIIEDELAHLLQSPYWQQPRDEVFEHTIESVPADLVAKTLDMCRLDNIPVHATVTVPWLVYRDQRNGD